MSNRELGGRSVEIDYAALGRARVQALLDSGNSGWTPHQIMKAREWLENLRDEQSSEATDLTRQGLSVGNRTFWATVVGILVALLLGYVAWKSSKP